jgi:hypothetical protein
MHSAILICLGWDDVGGMAEVEGDEGTWDVPGSGCCCGGWRVEDEGRGGCGTEVVAEEGSTEGVPRELGLRSGREE